jgi:hypothetical protein
MSHSIHVSLLPLLGPKRSAKPRHNGNPDAPDATAETKNRVSRRLAAPKSHAKQAYSRRANGGLRMGAWPVYAVAGSPRPCYQTPQRRLPLPTGSATLTADSPLAEMLSLVRGPARARAALFQSRCSSFLMRLPDACFPFLSPSLSPPPPPPPSSRFRLLSWRTSLVSVCPSVPYLAAFAQAV